MSEKSRPSAVKKYFRSIFNLRAWSDWNRVEQTYNYFLTVFRKLFVIRAVDPSQIKSFDQTMEELGLTDETLEAKKKGLRRLYFTMLVLAGFFYVYGMYELLYGGFLSFILSVVFMFVALAMAFRYHFWCFQIKQRKLGCRFSEWFKATFVNGGEA